ncbi:hypothetical protein PTI98_002192 [Pleurotus ostreatus]|nr:hypothetical protein PTI98_002192 [Pleurotus ostreatus]
MATTKKKSEEGEAAAVLTGATGEGSNDERHQARERRGGEAGRGGEKLKCRKGRRERELSNLPSQTGLPTCARPWTL